MTCLRKASCTSLNKQNTACAQCCARRTRRAQALDTRSIYLNTWALLANCAFHQIGNAWALPIEMLCILGWNASNWQFHSIPNTLVNQSSSVISWYVSLSLNSGGTFLRRFCRSYSVSSTRILLYKAILEVVLGSFLLLQLFVLQRVHHLRKWFEYRLGRLRIFVLPINSVTFYGHVCGKRWSWDSKSQSVHSVVF